MNNIAAKPPGSYRVEEIKSADDFLNLREEWNKLVFEDPDGTVFQTWEWNFNVWKYDGEGKDLNILLVREKNGRLVGIAPFYSYEKVAFGFKNRVIEIIGRNFTDYRSFIAKSENNIAIHAEILNWLDNNQAKWDIIDLHYVSEESLLVKNFDVLFVGRSKGKVVIRKENISPYMPLYPNRDFYENLYNGTLAKQLKRKFRKLEKDLDYRLVTISDSSELEGYLHTLFDLHKKRRSQKLQLGMFRSENQERVVSNLSRDLLERGWLRPLLLLIDDRPAACLYNFEFKNKIYFYQSGLEPDFGKYSLGALIHSFAIRDALKRGMEEYDLLSGSEDYKKDWTENYRNLYRIRIVSPSSKKAVFFNANEKLSDVFYNSKFYHSRSVRRIYFWLKNLKETVQGGNVGSREKEYE